MTAVVNVYVYPLVYSYILQYLSVYETTRVADTKKREMVKAGYTLLLQPNGGMVKQVSRRCSHAP